MYEKIIYSFEFEIGPVTFFLEAFLVAKPGRVTVRLLPNRMIRERCIAPITLRCN